MRDAVVRQHRDVEAGREQRDAADNGDRVAPIAYNKSDIDRSGDRQPDPAVAQGLDEEKLINGPCREGNAAFHSRFKAGPQRRSGNKIGKLSGVMEVQDKGQANQASRKPDLAHRLEKTDGWSRA